MIRGHYLKQIDLDFQVHPIVVLLGPRQSGKTTLARQYAKSQPQAIHYFDLEDPTDLAALADPKLTLSSLAGLIIIDEVQRLPELFPVLRVLVDQNREKQQFLILGSASRTLIFQTSETLAGRVAYLEVHPFSYHEIDNPQRHWIHGGYPLSYLTENSQASESWRENYIRTYLEMDLPMLGIRVSSENIRRFWMMLAHYHGNIVNYSELGRSLQVSHVTVKHYLDILVGTFMVRQIQPLFANIGKRQVKSPKIFLRDSGIFHSLLGITDQSALSRHPKLGASWEGYALEEIIRFHQARPQECFFWATHNDAEIDLIIEKQGKRHAFEFKYSSSPKLTKSMKIGWEDLKLDTLTVIFPGEKRFRLNETIEACGLENYLTSDI